MFMIGWGLTIAELGAVLYEERTFNSSVQNQLWVHISDLIRTLKVVNASQMVIKKRNFITVDINQFDCDYYLFLNGDVSTMNAFTGEYMSNYSWAEFTAGRVFFNQQQSE